MNFLSIDFHKITSSEEAFTEELRRYLFQQEHVASEKIARALKTMCQQCPFVALPPSPTASSSLHDVSLAFSHRLLLLSKNPSLLQGATHWRALSKDMSDALWGYGESLKECVVDITQILNQYEMEKWNDELVASLQATRELLLERFSDFILWVRRLEEQAEEYWYQCESTQNRWAKCKKLLFFFTGFFDRRLLRSAHKMRQYLNLRWKTLSTRFFAYKEMNQKMERSLLKFSRYCVFLSLKEKEQERFKKLYYLLKFWRWNAKAQSVSQEQLTQKLRQDFPVARAWELFGRYYRALQESFFAKSRLIKRKSEERTDPHKEKKEIASQLSSEQAELHTLAVTIAKYREFILGTDPNPYVSAKWGFSESVVGPEPTRVKKLLKMGNEIQNFDELYPRFLSSLEESPVAQKRKRMEYQQELSGYLHEMGLPALSYNTMQKLGEEFVLALQNLDELSSPLPEVVDDVHRVLLKAMRLDTTYFVLQEMPLFHQLFAIHMGVMGRFEENAHRERMEKFQRAVEQLEEWVEKREVSENRYQVELHVNEIRRELQALVTSLKENAVKIGSLAIEQQILEYRYFFGKFFYFLRQHELEGKSLRGQLHFLFPLLEELEQQAFEKKKLSL